MTSTNISVGSWVSLKLGCGGQAFQRGTEHCFIGLVVGQEALTRGDNPSPLVKFFSAKGLRTICTLRIDYTSLYTTERPSDLPVWSVTRKPADT